jgi:hypothetical protein
MIGDEVQALKTRASLRCHASFQWICVTSKPYNDSHGDWENIKHHLQGVWFHTDLSIDLMTLHKEILDTQNSKLPIIHSGEVANRVLDALQGFNIFNILRHSFWILMGIIVLLLIVFCLFPVFCRFGMSQIFWLRAELHHVHLKYKKWGDVGSHEPQSDKVVVA